MARRHRIVPAYKARRTERASRRSQDWHRALAAVSFTKLAINDLTSPSERAYFTDEGVEKWRGPLIGRGEVEAMARARVEKHLAAFAADNKESPMNEQTPIPAQAQLSTDVAVQIAMAAAVEWARSNPHLSATTFGAAVAEVARAALAKATEPAQESA